MAQNDWAIVIGINEYEHHPERNLRYAVNDAQAMQDFLINQAGFPENQVITCLGNQEHRGTDNYPTSSKLFHLLDIDLNPDKILDVDQFWFFFSGHGVSQDGLDYLVTPDAVATDEKLRWTLSVAEVIACLKRHENADITLVLDNCRQQVGRKDYHSNPLSKKTLELLTEKGITTISACEYGKFSYELESIEHGAFTYALVEALKKQTIPDQLERDLCQRVKELNDSVKIGRKQRPVIRIEPVARASFPLLRDFVTEADLEVLQKRAWKAECLEDLDTAEQLWWKINDIPSSRSLRGEARESLQRIGQKRLFRSRVEQDLQLANRELNELRQQQQTWGHAAKKLTQLQNEKDLIVQELQTLEQHQIQLQQEKAELERQLAQAQASAEQELSLRQQQWQAETAKQLQQVQDSAQAKINQLNTALEQLQRQLEAQKTRERQASPATVSAGNSKPDLGSTTL